MTTPPGPRFTASGSARQDGIAALRSGDKAAARRLLADALTRNAGDLEAWLWLSGAVDDPGERRYCLRRVQALDPGHAAAARAGGRRGRCASARPGRGRRSACAARNRRCNSASGQRGGGRGPARGRRRCNNHARSGHRAGGAWGRRQGAATRPRPVAVLARGRRAQPGARRAAGLRRVAPCWGLCLSSAGRGQRAGARRRYRAGDKRQTGPRRPARRCLAGSSP